MIVWFNDKEWDQCKDCCHGDKDGNCNIMGGDNYPQFHDCWCTRFEGEMPDGSYITRK